MEDGSGRWKLIRDVALRTLQRCIGSYGNGEGGQIHLQRPIASIHEITKPMQVLPRTTREVGEAIKNSVALNTQPVELRKENYLCRVRMFLDNNMTRYIHVFGLPVLVPVREDMLSKDQK